MKVYKDFDKVIRDSKNILILSHVNPDGDTLGSMTGLYSVIKKHYKKTAHMLLVSKLPKVYEFLPHISEANLLDKFDKSREYDLVITVDVASLDRLVGAQVFFEKAKNTINIDHHVTNSGFGDLDIIEDVSSAGEVLFNIFKSLNIKLDKEIATSLYAAVMTDTGGFRFENTNSRVLDVASELLQYGLSPNDLFRKCYESKSKDIVLFQAHCVSKACFSKSDKIVYTIVYKKDMEKFSAGEDATDGIAEMLRAIASTEISFVVKEVDSRACKVSMRSKETDVAKVCAAFGGGGHKFAAGCTIKASCEEACRRILNEIEKGIL